MLANQLPLLQSGLEPAGVRDSGPGYCQPNGAHYQDRLSKETELIAFSDPNDLLSYPIPDRFVRDYVDSRLCPGVAEMLFGCDKSDFHELRSKRANGLGSPAACVRGGVDLLAIVCLFRISRSFCALHHRD